MWGYGGGYRGGFGMGWLNYYMSYILWMLPALILVLAAQVFVKSRYSKYSKIPTRHNITGRQAAMDILNQHGVFGIEIKQVKGNMTDYYDPKQHVIFLSEGVYNSTSIAAVGIAAHEAGHAIQHEEQYIPAKIRTAIVPACRIGSAIGLPMCVLGFIFAFDILVTIGLVLFSLATVFQLITLPTEFNASKRAIQYIKSSAYYTEDEYKGAKAMLTAAAMTYVAALAQSVMQLLFYILRFGRRSN